MSKLTDQWIELFRAGNHGEKGTFTEADLDRIVANYQPASGHEAPATIGHIKGDAPAWGWFGELKRAGTTLLGKLSTAQPEFEEMVEKGLFKKRSVGLVKGNNGWMLHHVAWLGAKPPEIKGLADCKFDGSSNVVEVEFQENQMAETQDGMIARLNAWFEEKFGTKTAASIVVPGATTFSEADMKRFAAEAVTAAVTPLQQQLDAQKKEFSERDQKLATTETAARAEGAITRLKSAGRWVPAFEKMGLGLVFAELAKTTQTVEFGEGAEKKTITPLDALVAFMEQLPRIVPTGEVYQGQTVTAPAVRKGINVDPRLGVDANSVRFDEAVQAYAEEHKIGYTEAAFKVAAKHPELTVPGGAAAGAV